MHVSEVYLIQVSAICCLLAGDDDDIVMQAFKEQTAQYKQVYEASKVLTFCIREHLSLSNRETLSMLNAECASSIEWRPQCYQEVCTRDGEYQEKGAPIACGN